MRLIVNADDFGRLRAINEAVVRAHREGVLTSTSLMVTGEAWLEAVDLAGSMPSLAVGLHLVLAGGRSLLGPERLPHLVDARGAAASLGLRYTFGRAARAELAQEMAAQFERFAETGLALSHVDGHLHMHVHPVVFDVLMPMALRYGARGLRLPRDEFWFAATYDPRDLPTKALWALVFGLLSRRAREIVARNGRIGTRWTLPTADGRERPRWAGWCWRSGSTG